MRQPWINKVFYSLFYSILFYSNVSNVTSCLIGTEGV